MDTNVAKKLIIIESPGKLSSFKKIVGSDYEVIATFGHCVDLPKKQLSVKIDNNFETTFDVIPEKKNVIQDLIKSAQNANVIYLMTDPDREGEAISYHVRNILQKKYKGSFKRAVTSEITKSGINNALNNTRDIDEKMIDAYLCRRVLDRLVGYKTSFITKQATGGTSAGRVQSVMLRIMADREKEILNFKPEEYWIISAEFRTPKKEFYTGFLDEKIKMPNETTASKIYNEILKKDGIVQQITQTDHIVVASAPFTTNTLIQSASTVLGWTADKTMKVAQSLYETGKVTYIRTDSVLMSQDALPLVRQFVESNYDKAYLPQNIMQYKNNKKVQEGHECIRPIDVDLKSIGENDDNKLYTLIWKKTISSQMTNGIDKKTKIITKVGDYNFFSHGSMVVFDGFRKCWNYSDKNDVILPEIKEKDICQVNKLNKDQKFTTPPRRFSDASLAKKCEELQVTRPATFAPFLKTLQQRGYITREKKSLKSTDLGIDVNDFLCKSNFCFIDFGFTSEMEDNLDSIANGDKNKTTVLSDFWSRLSKDINTAKTIQGETQKTQYTCPKCQSGLLLKHSKFGPFFSCEKYKKPTKKNKDVQSCAYKAKVGKSGEPIEVGEPKQVEYAPFNCKNCNSQMIKRQSKFGTFFGCSEYPKCKTTASLDGIFKEPGKKKFFGKKNG